MTFGHSIVAVLAQRREELVLRGGRGEDDGGVAVALDETLHVGRDQPGGGARPPRAGPCGPPRQAGRDGWSAGTWTSAPRRGRGRTPSATKCGRATSGSSISGCQRLLPFEGDEALVAGRREEGHHPLGRELAPPRQHRRPRQRLRGRRRPLHVLHVDVPHCVAQGAGALLGLFAELRERVRGVPDGPQARAARALEDASAWPRPSRSRRASRARPRPRPARRDRGAPRAIRRPSRASTRGRLPSARDRRTRGCPGRPGPRPRRRRGALPRAPPRGARRPRGGRTSGCPRTRRARPASREARPRLRQAARP